MRPDILETALLASYAGLGLSIPLSTGLWVFWDARARGSDQPYSWGIYLVLFHPFAPLYYLYKRYRRAGIDSRSEPPTKYNRFLAVWAPASFIAFAAGFLLVPWFVYIPVIYTYKLLAILIPIMHLLVYRSRYWTVLDRVRV